MSVKDSVTMAAAASTTANLTAALHPHYPLGIDIPGYVANTLSARTLVSCFAAAAALIFSQTYRLLRRKRPDLPISEVATAMWFALCGFIHLFFEGYFVTNSARLGARTDLFGQLWKEYALSDSRYLTRDAFVVCMEAVTALAWGPLSLWLVHAIVSARAQPLRHPAQAAVSLGQLYGDVLYYATAAHDLAVRGRVPWRPEPAYFWAYYVLCNAFWVVVPLVLLARSARETARAFALVRAMEEARGGEGKGDKVR